MIHTPMTSQRCQIVARSPRVGDDGVAPGMSFAEARSLLDPSRQTRLEEDDPIADRAALFLLAQWCQRFTPLVELEESSRPESLFLNVTGCTHLWGGEQALLDAILQAMKGLGLVARIALSDTSGSAWAVAHYAGDPSGNAFSRRRWLDGIQPEVMIIAPGEAARAVLPLPVEALAIDSSIVETLHQLGIQCVDQLDALNRSSVAARWGEELLSRIDRALARTKEVMAPCEAPVDLETSYALETAVMDADRLLVIITSLLGPLMKRVPVEKGVTRLEIGWRKRDSSLSIGLCQPTTSAEHLLELVRLALERTRLEAPVVEVWLRITGMSSRDGASDLFDDEAVSFEGEVVRLIDRLSSRLGRRRVLWPRILSEAQPELACRFEPAEDGAFRGSVTRATPQPRRPVRLFSPPRPIEVTWAREEGGEAKRLARVRYGEEERIEAAYGPERIATGWWRGRPIRRDYYRVELASGRRLWIFQDDVKGQWFLHGAFD